MSQFRASIDSPPRLDCLAPAAALPGGVIEAHGERLAPMGYRAARATIAGTSALVTLSRSSQVNVQVPDGAGSGDLVVDNGCGLSNPLPLRVPVLLAENLHPVANPAIDARGDIFATLSGARGQAVPVSIFRIQRDMQMTPFVRDMMNATGLAFDREGYLYASSRAEGTVYRIAPDGESTTYVEGMGIATGLAFDEQWNLYVGDRSGTIFKISPEREIFVFATLEPSLSAYHLAFNSEGYLFVSGPTTSSNQAIHVIDRGGATSVFYQGLGRAQGMAFDMDDNLYIAASLRGERGIVCITPDREAELVLSGNNLVGLAFADDGSAVLATRDSLYSIAVGVKGRPLI